jgi:hypothetical protein
VNNFNNIYLKQLYRCRHNILYFVVYDILASGERQVIALKSFVCSLYDVDTNKAGDKTASRPWSRKS